MLGGAGAEYVDPLEPFDPLERLPPLLGAAGAAVDAGVTGGANVRCCFGLGR